jgi:uncharacterized protein YjbI with pentapeptide repeats
MRNKLLFGCSGTILFAIIALTVSWIGFFGNPLDEYYLKVFKKCPGCRFEFSNADFSNTDLAGADLRGLNLRGNNFSGANLQKSNLDSILSSVPAKFRGANLSYSIIRNAHLPAGDFTNAKLEGSDLQNSDLIYARFTGANLRFANLTGANLTDTYLVSTDFRGANLTNAKICFLKFWPNLEDAIIKGALITGEGKGFNQAQKQFLLKKGAIVGGPSENCYR